MKKMTFTINLPNTPDSQSIISMLNTWSKSIPTVYFLDICSVSHIKDYKPTDNEEELQKNKYISLLENIDLEQNAISYFPAIMEKASDQKSNFSTDDLIEEATRDLDALERFFKKAKIHESRNFVFSYIRELKGTHPEMDGESYHSFLSFANKLGIYNSLADNKRIDTSKALCNEADRLGISRSHLVVLASLACIYECIPAKNVMKFKKDPEKFNSSNALGDIQIIQRIALLTELIETVGRNGNRAYLRTHFITDDEHLEKFYNFFHVNEVKTQSNDNGSTNEFNFTLKSRYIFPALYEINGEIKDEKSEKELLEIYRLIGYDASA